VFVASFSAVEKKTGEVISHCVWGQVVDSLLPVTDKVAFMQHGLDRPAAIGDWARVMEVVGELMEMTENYPRRYRVREFPGQAAWRRSASARCSGERQTNPCQDLQWHDRHLPPQTSMIIVFSFGRANAVLNGTILAS
jgi:hypothetical protein